MTTKQLAIYLFAGITVVMVFAGLVPPLLNAKDTLLNAIGAGIAIITLIGAILIFHAGSRLIDQNKNSGNPPANKEQ